MKFTIHGHRPSCLGSATLTAVEPTHATTAPAPHVQTINLGIFKIKIHRQTALQRSLLTAVAAPGNEHVPSTDPVRLCNSQASSSTDLPTPPIERPSECAATPAAPNPLRAQWSEWAQRANPNEEDRQEALQRLTAWLERNDQNVEPQALNLSHLGLTEVPALPEGVVTLDLTNNRLTSLPTHFPATLQSLCVVGNELEYPPQNLPRGLLDLDLAFNFIREFPENLPPNLLRLELGYNDLSILPRTLPQFRGINTYIDLEGNLLTPQEYERLRTIVNAPDYQGPRIFFAMDAPLREPFELGLRFEEPHLRLDEAVLMWPHEHHIDSKAKAKIWESFATEPGAPAFTRFLERLQRTVNFSNPLFQRSVSHWLNQLEIDPELRSNTFAVSEGSTTSCEDRVSLTYNSMRQLHLSSAVARGDYDHQLPELLGLARGMFRLDQLEVIAREKAASLNFVDEIEVYLAYQVKLLGILDLPLDAPDMRFFNMSSVSQQDLDDAVIRVLEAEKKDFHDYLASHWQPWQAVLERLDPEHESQTQTDLLEAIESQFDARLQAELKTRGLLNDADTQRLLGPKVATDIAHEIQGARTDKFLQRQGLLALLQPHQ